MHRKLNAKDLHIKLDDVRTEQVAVAAAVRSLVRGAFFDAADAGNERG